MQRRNVKKIFFLFLFWNSLLISACSLQSPTQQTAITKQAVITPTLVRSDLTWEQSILVSQLSKSTGVSTDEILVASTESLTWSDHCLGIIQKGVVCVTEEVSGYRFVLFARDKQYEFHTSKDMSEIQLVESK